MWLPAKCIVFPRHSHGHVATSQAPQPSDKPLQSYARPFTVGPAQVPFSWQKHHPLGPGMLANRVSAGSLTGN